jgi:hypothetical protein
MGLGVVFAKLPDLVVATGVSTEFAIGLGIFE